MPLDNKKLPNDIVDSLRNLSYSEKVRIYDKNCKGCGCMCIIVDGVKIRSLEEAVDIAQTTGANITRTCDYEEEYPSLTEIVCNTCRFWNIHNIETDIEDEEGGYEQESLPK